MPYANNSPLKDPEIRHMSAATCLAEIALAAGGEWNPSRLEELIDGRAYGVQTGIYRRMARGYAPEDQTALRLGKHFNGACDIEEWRDHALWRLLSFTPLEPPEIEDVLFYLESDVRKHVWVENKHPYFNFLPQLRSEATKRTIDEIAKHRNLEALMVLIIFTREALERDMPKVYRWAAQKSLSIFPDVVGSNPRLYMCWRLMVKRLSELIWEPFRLADEVKVVNVDITALERKIRRIVQLARNDGISFPPDDLMNRHSRNH